MKNKCLLCRAELVSEISWGSLFTLEKERVICFSCESKLSRIEGIMCSKCGRQMKDSDPTTVCEDCQKWATKERQGYLQKNIACYAYNEFAKDLMTLYKYRGDYAIAKVFAARLKIKWTEMNKEMTIPLPISLERRKERGFNQTEGLLCLADISFETDLRREHTEKQSKKTRKERIEQEQFFFVENKIAVQSKEIVLIDDIYTTGATLHLAAEALIKAGAKSVSALTIFR
ncbi:ComF family protein [Listeria rustica]|uniref:ComF family protein n=1 Tax=Listeria rustica TaxID=2713503 RepID=A0A7W1T897_9LIST|nr:ComF family protein [Listeria rustica]MBA3927326.1 ComF family protein [Listeria rustica]